MPTLDLMLIKDGLFRKHKVVRRLVRDYELDPPPDSPESLASALTGAFGQTPIANPLAAKYDARQVFRAAVRALASNARSWSTFLKFERRLTERLHDCDPAATWEAMQNGALRLEAIVECLPGQTGGSDAKAIARCGKSYPDGDLDECGTENILRGKWDGESVVLSRVIHSVVS